MFLFKQSQDTDIRQQSERQKRGQLYRPQNRLTMAVDNDEPPHGSSDALTTRRRVTVNTT
jgi:hypothetical protein